GILVRAYVLPRFPGSKSLGLSWSGCCAESRESSKASRYPFPRLAPRVNRNRFRTVADCQIHPAQVSSRGQLNALARGTVSSSIPPEARTLCVPASLPRHETGCKPLALLARTREGSAFPLRSLPPIESGMLAGVVRELSILRSVPG